MKVAFLDIKSQIASYIQIRTLHPGKQIANSKTAQILSLLLLLLSTVWKNEKFTLTEKIFRQINCWFHEIFAKNAREENSVIFTLCMHKEKNNCILI